MCAFVVLGLVRLAWGNVSEMLRQLTCGGVGELVHAAVVQLQGLIRYYRPELELRMSEYHERKAAAKQTAAAASAGGGGKSVAAGHA